jgi:cytochrome P450
VVVAVQPLHEPMASILEAYRRHGPVFHFGGEQDGPLVLAGPEVNLFLSRSGDEYLGTAQVYGHMAEQLNSRLVSALEGEEHRQMRRTLQRGYNWDAIEGYLPALYGVAQRLARHMTPGEVVPAVRTIQDTVVDGSSSAMTGISAARSLPVIKLFFGIIISAALETYRPDWLGRFEYRVARETVLSLARDAIAAHRAQEPADPPDYIDRLLLAGDELAEEDLVGAAVIPFFAGIDTVTFSTAFMLHAVLADPDLHERLCHEIQDAFAGGPPSLQALREMRLLRATVMETVRRYPVTGRTARIVKEPFVLGHKKVDAGQRVQVVTVLPHFLPEFFPDPLRFEPDRFLPPRNEHRAPGAFGPFFRGAHTCIGAGLAEIQMMTIVGTLLHERTLSLDPDEQFEVVGDALIRPRDDFSLRVVA